MRRTFAWLLWLAAATAGGPPAAGAEAVVGEPAPDFALADSTGAARSLGEFKGWFVVLEWFNPECPFVRKHYDSGNMQRLQAAATGREVVWLTLDSSAPGKQGYLTAEEANAVIRELGARQTALLLDPDGTVGRRYGAKATPHLFLISPEGRLLYAGAIDDRPSVDPDDIPEATNYLQQALDEALAGKPVSVPQTKPYGCSVKY
ncbi:MAG: thioredoxin family protein [Candidatus Omnitrophica bacterium]|nr:thioredoxin family protein [Candidatus Omnitrophota bacterium]